MQHRLCAVLLERVTGLEIDVESQKDDQIEAMIMLQQVKESLIEQQLFEEQFLD